MTRHVLICQTTVRQSAACNINMATCQLLFFPPCVSIMRSATSPMTYGTNQSTSPMTRGPGTLPGHPSDKLKLDARH